MSARRLAAALPEAAARGPSPEWRTCPHCWGQRRVWTAEEAGNGEGTVLVPSACPACMGIGDVLR